MAVVVLAWLAVMERDAHLQARVVKAAGAGDVARAQTDLRRARFLNPDTSPMLLQAFLQFGRGQRHQAAATVDHVLRLEPENLPAWRDLTVIARGHDRAALRRANAAVARLDPLSAAPAR